MKKKLNQTAAAALKTGANSYVCWDERGPPGYGCKVTPNSARSWVFSYRAGGGRRAPQRQITLGAIDALPYAKARREAERLYHRTKLGEDPAGARDDQRGAPSVDTIIERYMREEIVPAKKPSTVTLYAKYFRNHISPALGRKRARDVGHADVARLHRAIGARGNKVAANRVAALVSSLYGWAGKAGEVPRGLNPAREVTRFREQARTRYLSGAELATLGATLALAESKGLPYESKSTSKHAPKIERLRLSPHAIGAIRLLLFTGCRLGEILTLRWEDVDFERALLNLQDSKTGSRAVWLSAPALAVLQDLLKIRIGDYVIAGDGPDAPRRDLHRPWRQIVSHAGLQGVTLHTLRHTAATTGVSAGIGLPLVGALLGHKVISTTARYAHIDASPARRAAETIGATLAAALGSSRPAANVVGMQRKK